MSIYAETRASDLNQCLNSLSQQTLPATEIVLVWDGPVDSTVKRCVESYESAFLFKHLPFSRNRGLGPALRDGLKACNYELIARVDSDDWSIPERFYKQAQFLQSEPHSTTTFRLLTYGGSSISLWSSDSIFCRKSSEY